MTQTRSVTAWSQDLQAQMMAAIDAAWRIIDTSDDPAAVRRAREKARVCGVFAATVRKIAAITGPLPAARPPAPPLEPPAPDRETTAPAAAAAAQVEHAVRALDRLKGGRRGRL